MIKVDEIQGRKGIVWYTTDDDVIIQLESPDIDDDTIDDAMRQFSLILSVADRGRDMGREIERHMSLNGYDGVASIYKP